MALKLDRLNILIVDDNPYMRVLVRDILHGFGVRNIMECNDGSAAMQELKHWPADLSFVDWMMEPLDGLDFTRLVRTASDSPNPFLPIVMLTGHTERHRIVEARDAGVNEFLAKPVTPLGIYSRIRAIVENPRPFVRVGRYMGPCRRRKVEDMVGEGRRESDEGNTGAAASGEDRVAAANAEGALSDVADKVGALNN